MKVKEVRKLIEKNPKHVFAWKRFGGDWTRGSEAVTVVNTELDNGRISVLTEDWQGKPLVRLVPLAQLEDMTLVKEWKAKNEQWKAERDAREREESRRAKAAIKEIEERLGVSEGFLGLKCRKCRFGTTEAVARLSLNDLAEMVEALRERDADEGAA